MNCAVVLRVLGEIGHTYWNGLIAVRKMNSVVFYVLSFLLDKAVFMGLDGASKILC